MTGKNHKNGVVQNGFGKYPATSDNKKEMNGHCNNKNNNSQHEEITKFKRARDQVSENQFTKEFFNLKATLYAVHN